MQIIILIIALEAKGENSCSFIVNYFIAKNLVSNTFFQGHILGKET